MKYVAGNGYIYMACKTTTRNAMSHIKFEQPVQKLYKQKACGGHLGFSLFVYFLQTICKVVHLGCVCGWSTGQPFTARNAPQILLAPWVYFWNYVIFNDFGSLLGFAIKSMFRSISLSILWLWCSQTHIQKNKVRNYCNLCRVYHSLRTWSSGPF